MTQGVLWLDHASTQGVTVTFWDSGCALFWHIMHYTLTNIIHTSESLIIGEMHVCTCSLVSFSVLVRHWSEFTCEHCMQRSTRKLRRPKGQRCKATVPFHSARHACSLHLSLQVWWPQRHAMGRSQSLSRSPHFVRIYDPPPPVLSLIVTWATLPTLPPGLSTASVGSSSADTSTEMATAMLQLGLSEGTTEAATPAPVHFSVSSFTTEALSDAAHQHELSAAAALQLHVDCVHMGVGGDDSWTPSVRLSPAKWQWFLILAMLSVLLSLYTFRMWCCSDTNDRVSDKKSQRASSAFLPEISVRSPWKLFISMI